MRLWLNRSGEVSLRQQLRTQIVLGILCGELKPAERLPSTRELARRFQIHANTASAAYLQLEAEGWLEFRHGSGVFVRASRPAMPASPELAAHRAIDQLIGELVAKAQAIGGSPSLVRERLRLWLSMEPPSRWLVVEPEPELRQILIFELKDALRLPITGATPDELRSPATLSGAMPLAIPNRVEMVRNLLPPGIPLTTLQLHPVTPSLNSYLPAPPGALIGIASRWKEFQRIAMTMLIATGIPPESLLIRDATQPGWKRGLETARVVVCDAATHPTLPKTRRPIPFRLLAESMLAELRAQEARLIGDASPHSEPNPEPDPNSSPNSSPNSDPDPRL
jgi:GntR family transcriptional regulator